MNKLLKLKSDDEFEELCLDLWKEIWNDHDAARHGVSGSTQNGVDIYGTSGDGKSLGLQCKNVKKFTVKELRDEVEEAKSFRPTLHKYTIAISISRNTTLQKEVRLINIEHENNGLFKVTISFWEDIEGELLKNYHYLVKRYWPDTSIGDEKIDLLIRKVDSIDSKLSSRPLITESASNILLKCTTPAKDSLIIESDLIPVSAKLIFVNVKRYLDSYNPDRANSYLSDHEDVLLDKGNSDISYQFYSYKGSAYLHINKFHEACECFKKALETKPTNHNALMNYAIGCLTTGKIKKAREIARNVIKLNSNNEAAYIVIIQTSISRNLNTIINSIPNKLHKAPKIAYSIAYYAHKNNDNENALKWIRLADKSNKDYSFDIKALHGEIILALLLENKYVSLLKKLSFYDKQLAHKGITAFEQAWFKIKDTDMRKYRVDILVNLASLQRLYLDDNLLPCLENINEAISIEKKPLYFRLKAQLLFENGDTKNAIAEIEKVTCDSSVPEAGLLYSEYLWFSNKSNDAISFINNYLRRKVPEPYKEQANVFLFHVYLGDDDFRRATILVNRLIKQSPKSCLYNALNGSLLYRKLDVTAAHKALLDAIKCINDETSMQTMLFLADELYKIKDYKNAAYIYKDVVPSGINDDITKKLVRSIYLSGLPSEVISICKILRNQYGPLEFFTETEISIYEDIGDFKASSILCENYLKSMPDDQSVLLRLARSYFELFMFKELDRLLKAKIAYKYLPIDLCLNYSYFCFVREMYDKGIESLYELRRRHYNNAEVHKRYFFFYAFSLSHFDSIRHEKIDENTAVTVQHGSDNTKTYIFEKRDRASLSNNELGVESSLFNKIKGKTIGMSFTLNMGRMSKQEAKIVRIESKYVYAARESLKLLNECFNDSSITDVMNFDENNPDEIKSLIHEQLRHNYNIQLKRTKSLKDIYYSDHLNVGGCSLIFEEPVYHVWNRLISEKQTGFACCIGTHDEYGQALKRLEKDRDIILDRISIYTIFTIQAENVIGNNYRKLYVSQSTLSKFNEFIIRLRQSLNSDSSLTLIDGKVTFMTGMRDHTKALITDHERIIKWILKYCTILPCEASLNIEAGEKRRLDELLGIDFHETLLIARDRNFIAYSDDLNLRIYAMGYYNLNSIWTQVLLIPLLDTRKIGYKDYIKYVLKLAKLNYKHLLLRTNDFIEAGRQSEWIAKPPLSDAMKYLSSDYCDLQKAVDLFSQILIKIENERIQPIRKSALYTFVMNEMTRGRNRVNVTHAIEQKVRENELMQPLRVASIMNNILQWQRSLRIVF